MPYILPGGRLFARTASRRVNHVVFCLFAGGVRNIESYNKKLAGELLEQEELGLLSDAEIIEELEPVRRGIYGGAIGYVDFSGNLDSCIAIRTIVVKDNVAYFQAGGGVVYDSIPENEYQETLDKMSAPLEAVKQLHVQ